MIFQSKRIKDVKIANQEILLGQGYKRVYESS